MATLTQADLKELLHYDPLTGVFTWRVYRGPNAKAGATAGFASQGWRRNGVSNMSRHSQATHWRRLPAGPIRSARNGGEA